MTRHKRCVARSIGEALRFRMTMLTGELTERGTFVREPGALQVPSAPPDFLSRTVASVDYMRPANGASADVALPLE